MLAHLEPAPTPSSMGKALNKGGAAMQELTVLMLWGLDPG